MFYPFVQDEKPTLRGGHVYDVYYSLAYSFFSASAYKSGWKIVSLIAWTSYRQFKVNLYVVGELLGVVSEPEIWRFHPMRDMNSCFAVDCWEH